MKILNDLAGLRIQLFEMYMVLRNIAGLSTVLPLSVLLAVGFQRVVDPTAEQGRFHRSPPGFRPHRGPFPQSPALRQQAAFFHDPARRALDAEADRFLVNVESDIVKGIHRVLRVSFLSRRFPLRSQHRSRFENPSSFHLCIHTDGNDPNSDKGGGTHISAKSITGPVGT